MKKKNNKVIQYAVVGGIAAATVATAAVEAIVGYIAVYFFAPVWKSLVDNWNKRKNNK
jgi:uncharacterized membrane protein